LALPSFPTRRSSDLLRLGRDHAPSGPPASTLRARCWPRPDGRAGSVIVVLGLSARWSQRRESVSIQGIAARAVKTRDASAPTATSPVRRGHQARAATTARAAAGPPSVSARATRRDQVPPFTVRAWLAS